MSAATQARGRIVATCCPLCTSGTLQLIADRDEGAWSRCDCGVVLKTREPQGRVDAASLGDGEAGRDHYDSAYFERYARRRRRRIAKSRRQILDALEVAPRGRLLDVGCSLGYTLEAARQLGLDSSGVDVAARAIAECRSLGFDAHPGTLDALPFEDASFAIVVLKHVFEHTPAPREALREIRRVLVPGGAVFFAMPNADYRRGPRAARTTRFFRGEAGRAHYLYWSPSTLARLLEEEGFEKRSVHPRVLHRRRPPAFVAGELALLPLRLPLRALADALGLRKEFWLVAVRR